MKVPRPATAAGVPPDAIVRRPGWTHPPHLGQEFVPPKGFQTSAQLLRLPKHVPTVHVTELALFKMDIIVGSIGLEVGWLGTAQRRKKDFIIDDVFLFDQTVSYGHTEITTDTFAKFANDILAHPDGETIFNSTRFWGHSHHNGGTSPSGQDDRQMEVFESLDAPFMIRGIFNRLGEASFSVFDYERNIVYHRAPWRIIPGGMPKESILNELYSSLRSEMRARVIREYTYTAPARHTSRYQLPHWMSWYNRGKGATDTGEED